VTDWRHEQSPVRDQGTRSACVGFSVCAALEWLNDDDEQLSPEDSLWAAHRVGGDPASEGTSVQWACEGLTTHSQVVETAWPFGNPPFPAARPDAATAQINQRAFPRWERIQQPSVPRLREVLEDRRPIVVTVRFVPLAWLASGGEIDAAADATSIGGHAVLATGVDDDDRVRFKNSWGEDWGDGGYGTMTRRYLDEFGVVAHALGDGPT
jgi:hypothetical protein